MKLRRLVFCLALAAGLILFSGALADVQAGSVTYAVTQADFVSALQNIAPTMGNRLLLVNVAMTVAADAKAPENPAFLMLAVDGAGRAYAPVLFDGTGDYAGPGAAGTSFQALFEVPQGNAAYRLAVLTGPQGEVAGYMDLPGMAYSAQAGTGGEIVSLSGEGYHAQVHGITQSSTAGVDTAPQGMKYVWLDVTLTGDGTQDAVSALAGQWTLKGTDGKEQAALTPTRAAGLLNSLSLRLNAQLPFVRGKICFLVPGDAAELSGLAVGGAAVDQKLPIGESEAGNANPQPDADGAYSQGGWKIILHGMRIVAKGTLADPPKGSQYLIVNLTVQNGSTRNIDVSSELGFAMTDDQGNELVQAWFADLTDTLDTTLMPTQSATGEVAFVLPDGAKPGNFRVHLSMLGEPLLIPTAGYIAQ